LKHRQSNGKIIITCTRVRYLVQLSVVAAHNAAADNRKTRAVLFLSISFTCETNKTTIVFDTFVCVYGLRASAVRRIHACARAYKSHNTVRLRGFYFLRDDTIRNKYMLYIYIYSILFSLSSLWIRYVILFNTTCIYKRYGRAEKLFVFRSNKFRTHICYYANIVFSRFIIISSHMYTGILRKNKTRRQIMLICLVCFVF